MAAKNATIDLFSALPQRFSAFLFANAKPVHLEAGQVLFVADDPGDGCYRIEKGLLKVSIVSASGEERILAILGPGAIVGELAVLDGLPRSASVVALRDSDLLFASKLKFDDCATKHPELYQRLLMLLASRLRETNDVIAAESFLPLRGRVAVTLLELAEHFGDSIGGDRILIRQKFKQPDLAAMAGIARENLDRILADWRRRKLVSRISGYYCLESKSALESEARCSSCCTWPAAGMTGPQVDQHQEFRRDRLSSRSATTREAMQFVSTAIRQRRG
jgi:CRP-like cAMP-binding protein